MNKTLAYFNIDAVNKVDKLDKLVKKVDGIRKRIADINSLIEDAQISASVKFEYERISSDQEILSAKIPKNQLENHFGSLIKLDTVSLLEDPGLKRIFRSI